MLDPWSLKWYWVVVASTGLITFYWGKTCFLPQMLLGLSVRRHHDHIGTLTNEQVANQASVFATRTQCYAVQIEEQRLSRLLLGTWTLLSVASVMLVGESASPIIAFASGFPLLLILVSVWIDIKLSGLLKRVSERIQAHLTR